MPNFYGKAVIHTYPNGERFEFFIHTEKELDYITNVFRIMEQSAKDEQARLNEQSQADDAAQG